MQIRIQNIDNSKTMKLLKEGFASGMTITTGFIVSTPLDNRIYKL